MGITLHLSHQLAVTLIIYFGQSVPPDVKGEAIHKTTSAGVCHTIFNICPCFFTACQSLDSRLIRIYVIILRNHKRCQALRAYICPTVTINNLVLSHKSTHREIGTTQIFIQTYPVPCSHFGPFRCPSRRQW